jgi:hypothetical protein
VLRNNALPRKGVPFIGRAIDPVGWRRPQFQRGSVIPPAVAAKKN